MRHQNGRHFRIKVAQTGHRDEAESTCCASVPTFPNGSLRPPGIGSSHGYPGDSCWGSPVTLILLGFVWGYHNRFEKTDRQTRIIKRRVMTTKPITSRSLSRLEGE